MHHSYTPLFLTRWLHFGLILFFALSFSTSGLAQTVLPWSWGFEGIQLNRHGNYNIAVGSVPGVNTSARFDTDVNWSGRIRIHNFSPQEGSACMTMDVSTDGAPFPNNSFIIRMDLSLYTSSNDLQMRYWVRDHGDENHAGDGVWVRGSSSSSWRRAIGIGSGTHGGQANGSWVQRTIDIDASLGPQNPTSTFEIRFGQEDNFRANTTSGTDGTSIDNILVTGTAPNCPSGQYSLGNSLDIIQEGFEGSGGFGVWRNVGGDWGNWTWRTGGTGSGGTGPSAAFAGSRYVYCETSGSAYPNRDFFLEGPCINVDNQFGASVLFRYHLWTSGSPPGTARLQVRDLPSGGWTTVWSVNTDQGNAWQCAAVDLSAYRGQSIQLRYFYTSGSTFRGDFSLDQIKIIRGGLPAACNEPPNLCDLNAHAVWNGRVSSDWGTSTNWFPQGVPNASSHVIIPEFAPNRPTNTANRTIESLTVDGEVNLNGGEVTVDTDVWVCPNGQIDLNNNGIRLDISGGDITIENGGRVNIDTGNGAEMYIR